MSDRTPELETVIRVVDYRRERRLADLAVAFRLTVRKLDAILRKLERERAEHGEQDA